MLLYIFFTEIYVTWLESARVARNRPSQITHLECVLLQSHRVITLGGCRVIFWAVCGYFCNGVRYFLRR